MAKSAQKREARRQAVQAQTPKDQNDVVTPVTKDQNDGQGTTKTVRSSVARWNTVKADKAKYPATMVITVPAQHKAKNPKRDSTSGTRKVLAASRFALYRDGDTIGDYVERSHKQMGTPKAKAMADVYWDIAQGFITVA